ncbi:MAG TPA: DUF411 domain-containing protein [Rhodothermales bacterium]|nr:DUF411 domain-containing protein [Rhodothermales bacterium]
MIRKTNYLFILLLPRIVFAGSACTDSQAQQPEVMVYKTPTCGCCSKWVEHLEENGFAVKTTDQADVTPIKKKVGLPSGLGSCHTAIVDGYVVEGHVPAEVVKKMLRERPDIVGISTPGMPIGSPGMEQGDRVDSYDVVAFDKNGKTSVYASY